MTIDPIDYVSSVGMPTGTRSRWPVAGRESGRRRRQRGGGDVMKKCNCPRCGGGTFASWRRAGPIKGDTSPKNRHERRVAESKLRRQQHRPDNATRQHARQHEVR
jgi:hypothetical protein